MALSVSALNEQIKNLLESTFVRVYIEAELSRITYHNSGHIYMTLKDASSTIRAVMFRGNAKTLKFRLEEGLNVLVEGALTLYKPRGEYQINCFMIEPSGSGALALAYEQLKERLQQKGYFESTCKTSLPSLPKKIALITSETGAALQDMLRVASQRWPLVELVVFDVLVQGEYAAHSIALAIKRADQGNFDILVIGRGGGSIEDLWAFNEEVVADAVFHATTPVVSAVGHEIDWVISDYVADLRAPTPSAAMQMILPDSNEMRQSLDAMSVQMIQLLEHKIAQKRQEIVTLKQAFSNLSIEHRLQQKSQEIADLQERFYQYIAMVLGRHATQVNHLKELFHANHPKQHTKKGFAQLSRNGVVVALSDLHVNDEIHLMDDVMDITATVTARAPLK